jgi:hypothetical protein
MVNEDGFWLQREHGEKMRKGAVQLTRRKDKGFEIRVNLL